MICSKYDARDILARTIYGEARGEYSKLNGGLAALIAVGNVIMNRVQARTWFGYDIVSVCHKKYQFSCWNARDINHPVIRKITLEDSVFQTCMNIARCLEMSTYPDLTQGSTHYHHQSIRPSWIHNAKPRAHIGCHIFYCIH